MNDGDTLFGVTSIINTNATAFLSKQQRTYKRKRVFKFDLQMICKEYKCLPLAMLREFARRELLCLLYYFVPPFTFFLWYAQSTQKPSLLFTFLFLVIILRIMYTLSFY